MMRTQFLSFLKLLTVMALARQGRNYDTVKEDIPNWAMDAHGFISMVDYHKLKGLDFNAYAQHFGSAITSLYHEEPYKSFSHDCQAIAEWLEENRRRGLWGKLTELSIHDTTFLDYLRKILLPKGSESSAKWLSSKVNYLKEPRLTKCFAGDLEEEYEHNKELPRQYKGKSDAQILTMVKNLAKVLPGNKDVPPYVVPQKQAKEEEPAKFALWEAGRTYLQNKAKNAVSKIIRTYGSSDYTDVPVLPVTALKVYLKDAGIVWPVVNDKLKKKELIDDQLTVYTKTGKKLINIPASADIIYNPNYQEDYNNKFEHGKGGMYYLKFKKVSSEGYTNISPVGRAKSNKAATFEKVAEASKNLEKYRKNWTAKLRSSDPEIRMAATILEIVYQSAIRIGSKIGSAKGADGVTKKTYGLTVLKRKNFKVLKNRVKLQYIGKAAQEQTQYLIKGKDPKYDIALNNLVSYLRDKEPDEFAFLLPDGSRFTAAMANHYMHEIGGVPAAITIHKFRHIKANSLAIPILESCPLIGADDNTVKGVLGWLNENMKSVGEELGHFKEGQVVGTTAIASYVDPMLVKKLFQSCNVQLPAALEKLVKEKE